MYKQILIRPENRHFQRIFWREKSSDEMSCYELNTITLLISLKEAGIKSTKYHKKRISANPCLTFEEFYTVLTRIELVLNSRPLTPLSDNPNDLKPLTPRHFLVGIPLTSLPKQNLLNINESNLTKFVSAAFLG
ncbi:hypothetical protein ILUMI_00007 [Ignelater luminosus]|uniref:Uncharacterized protein n=1 Tax=Ignelater luminosus TaxID=2038154 RepID=A0A8K0DLD3_IGNLU|nr:hypothetical protein ILUMI_00007 [Ignelater luminosus]